LSNKRFYSPEKKREEKTKEEKETKEKKRREKEKERGCTLCFCFDSGGVL
jgi:hypothetical protein